MAATAGVDRPRLRPRAENVVVRDQAWDQEPHQWLRLRVLIGRDCGRGLRRPRLRVLIGRDGCRGRRRPVIPKDPA